MIIHCFALNELTWLGRVIVGLAYTGLRIGELAQLRWAAIDLEANMLRVVDNTRTGLRRNNRIEVSTKTHASRSLPIHGELRRVLDSLKRHEDGRVFHGRKGTVIKPDVVRNVFIREVLKPLSLTFPGELGQPSFADGRLHSFRHYFCSKCARDVSDEQTVKLWLGHSGDGKITERYFHLHDEDAQRQMSKFKSVGGEGAA